MLKALRPADQKAFRDNYLAAAMICLAFLYCNSATAQYDSTKQRQAVNGYGFDWKNGKFGSLVLPTDTAKLAVKDSGAVAYKGGELWKWTGYLWTQTAGGGSGVYSADESTIHLSGSNQFSIKSTYPGQSSISNLGAVTIGTWQSTPIADGFIASSSNWNAKLASTLNSANIFVGNGSNIATGVVPSGDLSVNNTGVFSLNNIIAAGSCTNCNITFNAKGLPTAYTNGTGGGSGAPFNDNVALIQNNADNTRKVIISAANVGTGNTRTVTIQDNNYTAAGINISQSFSNVQTFVNPIVLNGLTGYLKGNNTTAVTAVSTIPNTDITGLGTASTKDVPASGNASTAQVVKGDDTRLTDSRAPTGTAGGSFLNGTYPNPGIVANSIGNAQAAQMAGTTIKANVTGSVANAADATPAQVAAILPVFSTSANGLAPTSPGGTTQFLRADGSYAVPPGSGGVTITPVGPVQVFTGTGVDSVALPTEIGMTFNKSSFSSISTDFPTNTGSFTTSSGHIVTGAGTALDTTKYISLPDVGYGNRWIKGYIMIAPTKTSTSPSPQVGVRSLVSTFIASQLGWVDLSTGADAGKTFYQGKGVAATKSTMALSWLAGDSILVYTKRYDDSLWVTAINIMAARRSIATLEYTFTSSGSASLENKGVTTIWTQGDPVTIINVFAANHDLKYSNLGALTDSKGQLYNASSFKKVFSNQLIDFYGSGVNYGQTGAKMQDLIDEEPDILAHHFKNVLIQVGCNDVGALSTYQTNIVLFYNWCKANGIRPIVMSVTYESARNLDAMYVWQSDPARLWVIDGNWIDVYNITRASNMLAADGTHLLDHAHDSITTRTIDQAVIPGGVNSFKRPVCANCNAGDVPYTAAAPDMMLASPLSYNGVDSLIAQKNTTVTANRYVMAGTGTNHAPFFPAFYIGDQTLGPLQYVMVSQAGILKFLKFAGSTDIWDLNNSGGMALNIAGSSLCIGCSIQTAAGLVSHSTSGARTAILTQGQIDVGNSDFGGAGAGADGAIYLRNQNTAAKENSLSANNNGLLFAANTAAMVLSRTLPNIGLNAILSPTAHFHIDAGSTTDPPFKIDGGSLLTTPQNYAWEVTSTHVNWTDGSGVRHQLDQQTGGSPPFADNTAIAMNNSDNTKLAKLDLSGITTATTRTYGLPDFNGIFAMTNHAQTWTGAQDMTGATVTVATKTARDSAANAASTKYVDGLVSYGGWTPTITGISNVSSSTLVMATFTKIGPLVHCRIIVSVVPTSSATVTQFNMSIPSGLAPASGDNDLGVASIQGGSGVVTFTSGIVFGTTSVFSCEFTSLAGTNNKVYMEFDYSL